MAALLSLTPAQVGGSGDIRSLLLKIYGGEVLRIADFKRTLVGTVKSRTVAPGTKTVQFPMLTNATAKYHVPGENILTETATYGGGYLNNIKSSDRVISLDRLLISPVLIDNIEEALTHFESRKEYVHQLGEAMLNAREMQIFALILKGARSAGQLAAVDTDLGIHSSLTTAFGHERCRGTIIYTGQTAGAVTVAEFKESLLAAAARFDTKGVPSKGRWCAVAPTMFWKLWSDPAVANYSTLNKDLASASNGTIENGPVEVLKFAGWKIIQSVFALDSTVDKTAATSLYYNAPGIALAGTASTLNKWGSAASPDFNDYATYFDTTKLEALIWHEGAVAACQWAGLTTEADWKSELQANLVLAKMVVGQEVLHPEFCGAIVGGTLTAGDATIGMDNTEMAAAKAAATRTAFASF